MPVPLHVHSGYSLLEGASRHDLLLERAAACGYQALALTDTNNLYGAVPFVECANRLGIRPILGACLRQGSTRCVALVADQEGYRNLCRILSRLHLNAQAKLPELLTSCASGLHLLLQDEALALTLREAFDSRLWLEIIRPGGSSLRESRLMEMGQRLGLKPVASCAVHFARAEDYPTFRVLTAIERLTLLDQLPVRLGIAPEHHLIDLTTWKSRFHDLPEAVENTDRLAEQLLSQVLPRDVVLPAPRVPRMCSELQYLQALCERGLRRRELDNDSTACQRLREELQVIAAGNLPGYFLVVRDIARHARYQKHSMALRGSAGNSLVCYLLEITDVNPLRFNLPLERFLHPGRVDLPDIDLDFDWKIRDEVLSYVFGRHGELFTGMISSHVFFQPRSAFRESARLHGLSNAQITELLESFDERVSHTLGDNRQGAMHVPAMPPRFPLEKARWQRIWSDARRILGLPHHLNVHPGGVVVTPRPLEEYVPLERAPKGVILTHYDKDGAEYIGLVKIDLLGNRALATVDAVRKLTGRVPHYTEEEPKTVELLRRGDTLGVNQLESPAMRHLLIQMRPNGLHDVIQALALIRPGAASIGAKETFIRRRRGFEPVEYNPPQLATVLHETQGIMLYEDDALHVLRALTGWSAMESDRFRKRVAKHRTEDEARILTREYLHACDRAGIPREQAGSIWEQLAKFNQYSFCKSHAVSYGLIAWEAACWKAHHPLEFWTGALNNNQGMYPKRVYVEAIKRAGLRVLLPCINRSEEVFSVEEDAIRTGLSAIASLPESMVKSILSNRQKRGPYRDLVDFRRRLQPGPEALAALIRSGAFDLIGQPRPALFLEAELQEREAGAIAPEGQALFPDDPQLDWAPADYEQSRRLRDEWALLGFVAGPPLMSIFRPLLPEGLATSCDLHTYAGKVIQIAGLVAASRHTPMADGRAMQFVTLEDEHGLMELTLFPGTCAPVAYLSLGPYLVRGTVEDRYEALSITVHEFREVR